jgi:hypothetical protein
MKTRRLQAGAPAARLVWQYAPDWDILVASLCLTAAHAAKGSSQ